MKIIVFMNIRSGAASGRDIPDRLRRALHDAGLSADIRETGNDLPDAVRKSLTTNPDAVAAAGGDGTVSTVAAALAGSGTALGIIPLGTLNHFAKDLGIPADLSEAARLLARPCFRDIDIGEAEGRFFINNCSMGLYPRMVQFREERRFLLGRGKWFLMSAAFLDVMRRYPLITVRLDLDGRSYVRRTPFLFVGNNSYDFSLFSLGGRASLDRGELCLYSARGQSRSALFSTAVRALFGRLDQGRDFEEKSVQEVRIETSRSRIRAALDGEIVTLPNPLRCFSRRGALRVIAPPPGPAIRSGQ
ncbi:MAG: diacylglycerol kinase family lipid kinase [Syntrophales bacterium]|nr:diacylglycerol kinase family lipid kinase [Syntrophales bacterium]